MRPLVMLPAAVLVMATLCPPTVDAQTEMSVTGAAAGVFPAGVSYLGVPLKGVELGMGLSVAGGWAAGQFQATLTGVSALGLEQNIEIEGAATSGVNSEPGTAIFSGTCTVDPGDGTPAVPGVPFTVAVAANPDGAGSLALTLGTTTLPAATVGEGYMTIQ
jgi:hypothetical protein